MPHMRLFKTSQSGPGGARFYLRKRERGHPGKKVPGPEAVQPGGQQVAQDGAIVDQGLHGNRFAVFGLLFSVGRHLHQKLSYGVSGAAVPAAHSRRAGKPAPLASSNAN